MLDGLNKFAYILYRQAGYKHTGKIGLEHFSSKESLIMQNFYIGILYKNNFQYSKVRWRIFPVDETHRKVRQSNIPIGKTGKATFLYTNVR